MTDKDLEGIMKSPEELFASISVTQKNQYAATLGELSTRPWIIHEETDTIPPTVVVRKEPYSTLYAEACVKEICKRYKRNDPMTPVDIRRTAQNIVDNYPFLTIYDLKDFLQKLILGRIYINGDYEIKAVDEPAIMARLKAYCELFTKRTYSSDVKKRDEIVPLGARGDFQRTHTADGTYMGYNWDADRYWQDWKRTHNWDVNNQQWVDAEYRTLDQAIEYWHAPMPTHEIDIISERVKRLPKHFAWS